MCGDPWWDRYVSYWSGTPFTTSEITGCWRRRYEKTWWLMMGEKPVRGPFPSSEVALAVYRLSK